MTGVLDALRAHPEQVVTVRRGRSWEHHAFSTVAGDVEKAAHLLGEAGIGPGTRLGILAENGYEWLVYDLAAIAVDAVSVGLTAEAVADDGVAGSARRLGLRAVVTSPELAPGGDGVEPRLTLTDSPDSLDLVPCAQAEHVAPVPFPEVFTLAFSSGTSGTTKCLMIDGAGARAAVDRFVTDFGLGPRDRMLICFPLSIFQQRLMTYAAILQGAAVVIANPGDLLTSLVECSPTVVIAPPQLYHGLEQHVKQVSPGRRAWGRAAGRAAARLRPGWLRSRLTASAFPPARTVLGGQVRVLLTGSAPTRPSAIRSLRAVGLPLYEAYGTTETGPLAWNRPGQERIGSVGRAIHPDSITIDEDGAIYGRPPVPFCRGYLPGFGDASATFSAGGAVRTGDRGYLDPDGFLHIEGRADDVIVTDGGLKVHPAAVELEVDGVGAGITSVLFGRPGGGTHLFVFAAPDARRSHEAEVASVVAEINRHVPLGARIQKVTWPAAALSLEDGTLTRNQKVSRAAVAGRHRSELGADAEREAPVR